MLKIIGRRLLISIPLLLVVSIITFVLQSMLPGDPAWSLLGANATQEQYEKLHASLNLDQPLWAQYGIYIGGVLHGDLGHSLFTGVPVLDNILQRLPVTLSLLIGATVVSAVVGIVLGVFSATRGRLMRRASDIISLVGAALPNFWIGLVLVSLFAIALPIFPATGFVPFAKSPSAWFMSFVLPVAALAIAGVAAIAKVTRDGMMSALGMDYIRTLRSCGVPERSLIWKHALKNSSLSVLTMIGLTFISFLSGAVLIEAVFGLPGLGTLAVDATNRRDIPVVQGATLAFTVIVIVLNLIIDCLYTLLNPKVRI